MWIEPLRHAAALSGMGKSIKMLPWGWVLFVTPLAAALWMLK
jgi:hypothetical protein